MKKGFLLLLLCVLVVVTVWYAVERGQQNRRALKETERAAGALATPLGGYPENFPQDLRLVSGPFERALRTRSASGRGVVDLTFRVPDSADNVVDLFRRELTGKGWTVFVQNVSANERLVKVGRDGARADILADGPSDALQSRVEILYYE